MLKEERVQKYITLDAFLYMSLKQSVFDDFVNTRTQAEVENEIKKIYANLETAKGKKRDISTMITEFEFQSRHVQSAIEVRECKLFRFTESLRKIGRQMPRSFEVKGTKRIFKK